MRVLAALPLLLVPWATGAASAEVVVLSAGAVEPGLVRLVDGFRQETGHAVRLSVGVPAALRERVDAGEVADLIVAPPAVVDALVAAGRARGEARAVVGRVGVGVVVRQGSPRPEVSSPTALREALLAADSLVYNRASTGTYFERLLDRLGIAAQVAAKTTRYPDGTAVLEHVARGAGREIGIGAITEIRQFEARGLALVGPLPPDLQNYTVYVAAVLAGSPSPEAAHALLRYVTAPAARAVFAATGVE